LLFAYAGAAMPSANGAHYYLQIMMPGFAVGAIIGSSRNGWGKWRVHAKCQARAKRA